MSSGSPRHLRACAVEQTLSILKVCHAQSCGKCVPCRDGLGMLEDIREDILNNKGTMASLELLKQTAQNIKLSADCAIGFEAANMVLQSLETLDKDFLSHVEQHRCVQSFEQPIPCVELCPANVDIPGYIALISADRCDDAVRLIRKDNPFPTACALICEHPCEKRCRRRMIDDAVKSYYAELLDVDPSRLFIVSIMPCVAKKHECALPVMNDAGAGQDVDLSITTRELDRALKASLSNIEELEEEEFDQPLGIGSGAGVNRRRYGGGAQNRLCPAGGAQSRPGRLCLHKRAGRHPRSGAGDGGNKGQSGNRQRTWKREKAD